MFYRITTDLTIEGLIDLLHNSKMVNINEWEPSIWSCYREEIVPYTDIDEDTVKLIDKYWIGVPLDILDITVAYEVYLYGGVLEFCFLDYHTYTDGFIQPVLFDIDSWNKAIEDILTDWEDELGSHILDVDADDYF